MKKTFKCGIAAAVVVAAGFAAYKSYGAYGAQDNSLLMQNIEALAQSNEPGSEPGSDSSEGVSGGTNAPSDKYVVCNGPLWKDSYLKTGKVTTIIHLYDSVDIQAIYPVSKCCAKYQGEGILEGNNVGIGYGTAEKETEVKCQGESKHRSLPEAINDFSSTN